MACFPRIDGGILQDPMEVRFTYHMFGHIFWWYSLKFRPKKRAKIYMVGTCRYLQSIGSWNGHWLEVARSKETRKQSEHRKNHHVSRQASPFRNSNTKVPMFAQKQAYWDGIGSSMRTPISWCLFFKKKCNVNFKNVETKRGNGNFKNVETKRGNVNFKKCWNQTWQWKNPPFNKPWFSQRTKPSIVQLNEHVL